MASVIPIAASISLLCLLPGLIRLRRAVRATTLLGAWRWAIAGWAAWGIAWTFELFPIAASYQDQLWYAAAILGLCPPIAVLGAKRPGARVWNVFVVIPLLLVFAWPALATWVHQIPPARLELETPMLIGYCLVLLMGFGNYLGTRNSLPALLTSVSLGWLAWQFAESPEPEQSRELIGPTVLLLLAGLISQFQARRTADEEKGFGRVWRDFQEAFGVVWAKRLIDRINHTAQTENWPARWNAEGLAWHEDATETQKAETVPQIDHTLRWLLRRFVDAEWIDKRL